MTRPQPLPDTWHSRELPVLQAAVEHFDTGTRPLTAAAIAQALSRDVSEVLSAIRALARGQYLTLARPTMCSVKGDTIADVSAEAYRATGAWPSPDVAADRLMAALEAAIERAPAGEQKTRLQKLRDGFLAAGRDFAVDVASGVLTGQITA